MALEERLRGRAGFYKVGLQLFTAAGPAAVEALKSRGAEVFLDLKLHDIPQTVASAVRAAAELGVTFCTVHLAGGRDMLEAAVAAAGPHMTVLGVSVLTSADEVTLRETGVEGPVAAQVRRLVALGLDSGVRGFVCSALEVAALRAEFGRGPVLVVPGIRPSGEDSGDQRRVATPAAAVRAGANHLVIGRPLSRASDPVAAWDRIMDELANS